MPQESVLSSLLFVLYIDLRVSEGGMVSKFSTITTGS